MTEEQREKSVFLAQKHLGPVFPVWGIVPTEDGTGYECECHVYPQNAHQREHNPRPCKQPGKHPRISFTKSASSDPRKLAEWIEKYPLCNFGIRMGLKCVLIDLDLKDGKDGVAALAQYALESGEVIPATVTARSGSGGRHLFFLKPDDFNMTGRDALLRGLDMKNVHGIAIAAGSQHLCGSFYEFVTGLGPGEIEVAMLPNCLRVLRETAPAPASKTSSTKEKAIRVPRDKVDVAALMARELPPAHKPHKDNVVLGVMRRQSKLRTLLANGPVTFDTSVDDMSLAWHLAFYTGHNWDQAMRLFQKRWRKKFDRRYIPDHPATYAEVTLRKGFLDNPIENWIPGKRKRKRILKFRTTRRGIFRANMGRPASTMTKAIIYYHRDNPALTPRQLADNLGLKIENVRRVLRNDVKGKYKDRM